MGRGWGGWRGEGLVWVGGIVGGGGGRWVWYCGTEVFVYIRRVTGWVGWKRDIDVWVLLGLGILYIYIYIPLLRFISDIFWLWTQTVDDVSIMAIPPTLVLAISPSLPKDIATIQTPLPTTQTQIEASHPPPKRLPKGSLFRRSFTWITPRHNNISTEQMLSPKTPDTEYSHDESFQTILTTRRGACICPKLPFPPDVMQVEKQEICEPHPGRRIDVNQGDNQPKMYKAEEDESIPSAPQHHIFLRTTTLSMHPPSHPDKRKIPHTPRRNSKPTQSPPHPIPLSRESTLR